MSTNQNTALLAEMAVFVRVVEAGSFSEAARQLASTPSAVSRAIARLERALGTRLLQRTTRKLRLSDSGDAVYQHCRDMLASAEAALAVSQRFHDEPQGLVRVSVPKAVGRFVLHPHMPAFLARYPKVDVHLRLEDRYVDLIDEPIDLAIRITDHPPPGMMGRPLLRIEHLLCASPQYLKTHGTPHEPHDLKQHDCIFLGEDATDSRWQFRQGRQRVTVQVHGRYAANHTDVRLDTALQHLGIASLPDFTARQALADGRLAQVLPDWVFTTRYTGDAWILYPPTRHLAPKLRVFMTFLAERLNPETSH